MPRSPITRLTRAYFYCCYISVLLPTVVSISLETDCQQVVFYLDASAHNLNFKLEKSYSYKISVEPSDTVLINYAFTILYDSGYTQSNIPFNELNIGSFSKTPKYNITLSRQSIRNWTIKFIYTQRTVTGFYRFQIGKE